MRRQDFLDHQVEVAAAVTRGEAALQAAQVCLGIEQAIDMIDAQAVDHAVLDQTQHALVRVIEHFRQLDAQARQIVDVEEAAVVDIVGGDAEIGERQCCRWIRASSSRQPALSRGGPGSAPARLTAPRAHRRARSHQIRQLLP